MGDTIDNIKGVPGIGEKGARELIAQYGTLDNLIAHASEIKNKRYREGLLAHADDARQSQALARIHTDVPVPFDPEALRYRGATRERCFQIFNALGFRAFVGEYAPTADTIAAGSRLVTTDADVRTLAGGCAEGAFAMDSARRTLSMRAGIVGLSFSISPHDGDYVPTGHRGLGEIPSIAPRAALEILRPVLEDPAVRKSGHDLKFDAIVLARHGVALAGLDTDTMLTSYLIDATRAEHRLEDLALEHVSYKALKEEDVCGRGARAVSLADVPVEATLDYAAERADLVGQLAPVFRQLLVKEQLERVYEELERPLIPVLVDIERAGIRIDGPALAAQSQRLDADIARRSKEIYAAAEGEFNINSPKQLAEVLFDKMQLPVLKRTGTSRAPSTAVEVLEELALAHDLPRMILEWRSLMKLKGTYIDALPQLVNPDTGRVYTCFNQAVAATGRLSSSDPNLQNIPIKTELGREIRRAFIADRGNVLISADYSQIEFRVLAHMSEDPVLVAAFREGADFHERTSTKIFGADSGRDPHQLRSIAKMVNYALLYGKGAFTLAKDIGVSQEEAQKLIDSYFAGFPSVARVSIMHARGGRARASSGDVLAAQAHVPGRRSRNFSSIGGRALRRQHADPGHGRGHHEARDDPGARGVER
jgi:DNA polymerase-1